MMMTTTAMARIMAAKRAAGAAAVPAAVRRTMGDNNIRSLSTSSSSEAGVGLLNVVSHRPSLHSEHQQRSRSRSRSQHFSATTTTSTRRRRCSTSSSSSSNQPNLGVEKGDDEEEEQRLCQDILRRQRYMKRLIELLPPCPTITPTTPTATVPVQTGTSHHQETAQLMMMEKILDEERDILTMCQQYKDLSSTTSHANDNANATANDDDSNKLLRSLSLPRPNTDISSTVLQL